MTQYHDPRTLGEAMCEIRVLREASREHNRVVKERDELRAALAAAEQGRDALQAKITVLEGHEHVGLLEAFDAYARQSTYNSHPAKPEHFPKSFIWFSAGYSAAGAAMKGEQP